MNVERKIMWLFRVNAVINWVVSIRGILDPVSYATAFGFIEAPDEYTFVIRLWASFIFMFGCMFWEVSRNVRGKAALIKYNWIEKTLTGTAVTIGFLAGQAPLPMMILITFTNWAWIPFLAYYNFRLHVEMSPAQASADDNA